jgi:putative DNA-invertase from lambdoid prophage Rac
MQRPGFVKLVDRLEEGDVLAMAKLDRLGRNAMDVHTTVEMLAERGVKLHCLTLGGVDLTSTAGRMVMQVLSAMAEFERNLIVERTHAGIERASAEGKAIGRPSALTDKEHDAVVAKLAAGASVSEPVRAYGTSRQSIIRARAAAGDRPAVVTVTTAAPAKRRAKKPAKAKKRATAGKGQDKGDSDHAIRAELERRGQHPLIAERVGQRLFTTP